MEADESGQNEDWFFQVKNIKGNAAVEFALVFPLFVLTTLAFIDLALLAIGQMALEGACAEAARRLSISNLESPAQMQPVAEMWLSEKLHAPVQTAVLLRSLPTKPFSSPYRKKKSAEIIELTAWQIYRPRFPALRWMSAALPLKLTSRVREARIQ